MIRLLIFPLLLVGAYPSLFPRPALAATSLEDSVQSALLYLKTEQTTGAEGYEPGQWRTQVTSTSLPSVVGVGKYNIPYEEPSSFIASSIANVLAEIYFLNREETLIPPMIDQAVGSLSNYIEDSVYYFYPPKVYNEFLVRGPRFMYLDPRWYGFTDTPPDADSTSTSYLLRSYQTSIQQGLGRHIPDLTLNQQALDRFESARDVNRTPHFYNNLRGDGYTGAYMTWLFDENNPLMPRDWFARPDKGERIPFNANDVDCVVNSNVLKMLKATGRTNTPGYQVSCKYLNGVVTRREFFTCGMYYPSDYALPYGLATALDQGVDCLEPSRAGLLDATLGAQETDGSWKLRELLPRPDPIQSTVWALNTLLILGDSHSAAQRAAVKKGVDFLLSQSQHDKQGHLYWPGQVFYAAIFVARFPVVWRSTAYTTALAAQALELAHKRWAMP